MKKKETRQDNTNVVTTFWHLLFIQYHNYKTIIKYEINNSDNNMGNISPSWLPQSQSGPLETQAPEKTPMACTLLPWLSETDLMGTFTLHWWHNSNINMQNKSKRLRCEQNKKISFYFIMLVNFNRTKYIINPHKNYYKMNSMRVVNDTSHPDTGIG